VNKRVTLAAVSGLTAVLALSACGGANSDTALNTAGGGQVAGNAGADLSQAKPSEGGGEAQAGGNNAGGNNAGGNNAGGKNTGGDVQAGGGGYGSADGAGKGSDEAGAAGQLTDSLVAKQTKNMGTIVVDAKGMTLYRFDKDQNKPEAKSTCYSKCAVTWPPALTNGDEPQLEGVDKALVGKTRRDDGKWQLTLKGWPLYYYEKDQKPGDWRGIGIGNVWWGITPEGDKADCPPGLATKNKAAAGGASKPSKPSNNSGSDAKPAPSDGDSAAEAPAGGGGGYSGGGGGGGY
jgi:predicted lipoprotein with Yx(FWY)xxD motif